MCESGRLSRVREAHSNLSIDRWSIDVVDVRKSNPVDIHFVVRVDRNLLEKRFVSLVAVVDFSD